MTTNSLIDKLRRRIKDDRPHVKGLTLSVSDAQADRAIAEVTNGHLIVQISGGSTPSFDFNLSDPRYATIGRLHQALTRMSGVTASLDEDAEVDHASLDIYPVAPTDVGPGRSGIELKHHLFSDIELDEVIEHSIQRHNPSFSSGSLPPSEEAFVMTLAHADICRRQAYDSSKRRGLDTTVYDLMSLADSMERTHRDDTTRLAKALVSPSEASPNTMGPGDVVVGTAYRASLRTGRRSPYAAQSGPVSPVLLEFTPEDIEDESVVVRWVRNSDNDFHSYELWMDTIPDIMPEHNVRAGAVGQPVYHHYEGMSSGSSRMVHRVYGSGILGQGARSVRVVDLEPNTTYYFKMYVRDMEGSLAGSGVLSCLTKSLRTRFHPIVYASTMFGEVGAPVTLYFDTDRAPITEEHVFRFGEHEIPLDIVNYFQANVVVPAFVQKKNGKSLVIQSPTGLRDIAPRLFTVY